MESDDRARSERRTPNAGAETVNRQARRPVQFARRTDGGRADEQAKAMAEQILARIVARFVIAGATIGDASHE